MGERMSAIQRRSYLSPSQNDGPSSKTLIDAGLKKMTVAMRNAVNMKR